MLVTRSFALEVLRRITFSFDIFDPWYYNIDMKTANTSSNYVEILWKAPGYPNRTKIHGNSGVGDGVEDMIGHSII